MFRKARSRTAISVLLVFVAASFFGCDVELDTQEGEGGDGGDGDVGASDAGGAGGSGGRGGTSAAFGCVGRVDHGLATQDALAATFIFRHLSENLGDPGNLAPFEGILVNVQLQARSEAVDSVVTNASGEAHLTLPTPDTGFDGYLLLRGQDLVPTYMHFNPPIATPTSYFLTSKFRPPAFKQDVWKTFAQIIGGVEVDPSKGHVIARPYDCSTKPSSMLDVTVNGIPAHDRAMFDHVWFNLEPGPAIVETRLPSGELVARMVRPIHAGSILSLHLGPSPDL